MNSIVKKAVSAVLKKKGRGGDKQKNYPETAS